MAVTPAPLSDWMAHDYIPDQMMVKFVEGTTRGQIDQILGQQNADVIDYWEEMRMAVVRLPQSAPGADNVLTVGAQIHSHAAVEYAEPDFKLATTARVPNDPLYDQQYGLNNTGQLGSSNIATADFTVPFPGLPGVPGADIDAQLAWDLTVGSADTVVAIIDTGVDYLHPDLRNNMWKNPGEKPDGIDNDKNGYIDDIFGYDFIDSDSDPMDVDGHGTHVAGITAAIGNNGIGVAGVSWNSKIMALRAIGGGNSGVVGAIRYAALMKSKYGINVVVSNNSYGFSGSASYSQAFYDAIKYQADAGITYVVAAGNDSQNLSANYFGSPSEYLLPNIVNVASMDRNDELSDFSNYGWEAVDIGAPGSDILSTWPRNVANSPTRDLLLPTGYAFLDGTSMASPMVAGAVALLKSADPSLTPPQIKSILMSTGDKLQSLDLLLVDPDPNDGLDWGARLNVNNALRSLNHISFTGKIYDDVNANGVQDAGEQPLSGVTVYFDTNNNYIKDANEIGVLSGFNGTYTLDSYQGPGTYITRAIAPAGYQITVPQAAGYVSVATTNNQTISNLNYGMRLPSGWIVGTKWNDTNGTGAIDGGDFALGGIRMFVDLNNDGFLGTNEPTSITTSLGTYQFYLRPGNYTVREIAQPGFQAIVPAGGVHFNVPVASDTITGGVDFLNRAGFDYGDAPLPFHSLNSNDGARHGILEGFGLGPTIDIESDGSGSAFALGDDLTGRDDEDGLTFDSQIFPGREAQVTVNIRNTSYAAGFFSLWVDFDTNGTWTESERIVKSANLGAGNFTFKFTPPATMSTDNLLHPVFARARYSYDKNLGPDGLTQVGEVEDYRLSVGSNVALARPDGPYVVVHGTAFADNPMNVLANDSASANGLPQLIAGSVITPPQNGVLRINNNGTDVFFEYQPNTGSLATSDSFQYSAWDGVSFSPPALVTISLIPQDVIPVEDILTVYSDGGIFKNTTVDPRLNDLGPGLSAQIGNITFAGPGTTPQGTLTLIPNGAGTVDDLLQYTPNAGATGFETWTYTLTDTAGRVDTVPITIQLNNLPIGVADLPENSTRPGLQAELQVAATDNNGNPLTSITNTGNETFWLVVYTRDPRLAANADPGVKAATADLLYDSKVVTPVDGTIVREDFGTPAIQAYQVVNTQFQTGDTTIAGIVNEAGGLNNPDPLTPTGTRYGEGMMGVYNPANPTANRYVLYRIAMKPVPGVNTLTNFYVSPADIIPPNDTLVNDPTTLDPIRVANSNVNFVQYTGFQVGTPAPPTPEGEAGGLFTNTVVPGDVNGDRIVDTIDILNVIYEMNRFNGPVETWQIQFNRNNPVSGKVDADGDGMLSVTDVLRVIYHANRRGPLALSSSYRGSPLAEGESSSTNHTTSPQSLVDTEAVDAIFGEGGL